MEFKLDFQIEKSDIKLSHNDSIVFIGSCFSDEISSKMIDSGFNVTSNPFGTLFHPDAIHNVLKASIAQLESVNVLERDDLFFSWDSASLINGSSRLSLIDKVLETRRSLREQLKKATVLVVTFGTAWKYVHTDLKMTVGNCHKIPQKNFNKTLSSGIEMKDCWTQLLNELYVLNPKLRVIFTVSPVRHKKDGLIENNRSKSELISMTHKLCESDRVDYFPSYEILIDELRDYRFYSKDLVHPSQLAVDYVWDAFKGYLLSTETISITSELMSIKSLLSHRSLYPGSKDDLARILIAEQKKKEFLITHPEIIWV